MTLRVHPMSKFGTIGAATVAAMASVVLAHPRIAAAESSPVETGTFNLTALTPSALVASSRGGQLQVCNETGSGSVLDEASALAPFTPSASSTLEVSYNGKTEQIMPGHCYRMNAQQVRITTNEPLGRRSDLEGTVTQVAPARAGLLPASNGTVGENAQPVRVEINEIRNDLKQDDRTTRQATAELNRATRELNLAAQELRAKPVA